MAFKREVLHTADSANIQGPFPYCASALKYCLADRAAYFLLEDQIPSSTGPYAGFENWGSEYRMAVRLRRRGVCGIHAKLLHYE